MASGALSSNLPWDLAANRWAQQINPFLANPLNGVQILKDIKLISGSNTIQHLLGQLQQGWFLVDIQGVATIYRSAPFNKFNLTLTSSAPVTVSIGVY